MRGDRKASDRHEDEQQDELDFDPDLHGVSST
jgi:hypothetical protein